MASPHSYWAPDRVPRWLDHILLGSRDLDRGIAFVEERLGMRAAFGGVHPGHATQNALLSLGPRRYLEIIAPEPQRGDSRLPSNSRSDLGRRDLRELREPRLVGWAVHPGNLEQYARRLRGRGIRLLGWQPGSRKRPDGRVLHWETLTLKDDLGGLLPFFIEWARDSVHPSTDAPSGAGLAQFSIASPNPADLEKILRMLDLDVFVERSRKPQLRATITGSDAQVMKVTS